MPKNIPLVTGSISFRGGCSSCFTVPGRSHSLPPTLTNGETDKARYLAIGESDRMTHRYVKVRQV